MYHYEMCGLPNVYLVNGFEIRETPYGEAVSINDIEGLHAAIARAIITNEKELDGNELRFLRKFLDMSQKSLGDIIGVTDQAIAKNEKGKGKIPGSTDRMVRMLVDQHLGGNTKLIELVKRINELDREILETELRFMHNDQWGMAEAC